MELAFFKLHPIMNDLCHCEIDEKNNTEKFPWNGIDGKKVEAKQSHSTNETLPKAH